MNPTVKTKFQNYMPLRVYKYLTQSTFVLHPFKAKALVHRQAAKLVSWSMRIALRGVWPTQGFEDELFDPKSLRGQMAGKELALGWRLCKSLKKLFGCNTAWSCYKTFANATLNEHVVFQAPQGLPIFSSGQTIKLALKRISLKEIICATLYASAVLQDVLINLVMIL